MNGVLSDQMRAQKRQSYLLALISILHAPAVGFAAWLVTWLFVDACAAFVVMFVVNVATLPMYWRARHLKSKYGFSLLEGR